MDKKGIVEALQEIALLLELKGENPFKIRAYQQGARQLETLGAEWEQHLAADTLRSIRGIGDALAEKIRLLHGEGRLPLLDALRAETPPGLRQMLEVPGLGPKRIKTLRSQLGVEDLNSLQKACEENRVAPLPGFGEKSQQNLLQGIRHREAYSKRHLWWDARTKARPILEGLRSLSEVQAVEGAGSLRRGMETVGDLDFIVAATEAEPVMDWFVNQPWVVEVTAQGGTKSSVRLEDGMQADLRVVPPSQFAFALHHFTGSKDHNVKMRQRALSRGWSLSEWGLTPRDPAPVPSGESSPPVIECEEALFRFLGLAYIPPELREGLDEIERAESGAMPQLVEGRDIRGGFHNHTSASDGDHSLQEMAEAAAAMGWEYLGIADHSVSSFQAHGLSADRLLAQVEQIRRLNADGKIGLHLFAGVECDILPDGSLDLPDSVLSQVDYVVASVHSSFSQPMEVMTARILRAMENPLVTMVGHPTGRLLLRREPYAVDLEGLMEAASRLQTIVELNANPWRLDLDWRWWRKPCSEGVLCAINPDAHSTEGLRYMETGVLIARKAGLRPDRILNTLSLARVTEKLQARRRPAPPSR